MRASGTLDVVGLDRVQAGTARTGRPGGAESRRVVPALAVDAARGRAYVVPATGALADVELGRLRVTYRITARRSPQAVAKSLDGPVRHARVLDGRLVVSGGDYAVKGGRATFTAAGVRVVDTRDWRETSVAPGADDFYLAGDVVVGMSTTWSSELHQPEPIGLDAYELTGKRRFHLHDGTRARVVYADERYAYVVSGGWRAFEVLELATGRVVGERRPAVQPLAAAAMPY